MNIRAAEDKIYNIKIRYDTIKTRKGKFTITYELIESVPEFIMKMLSKCIITRAESMYMNDSIEYHAMCPDFDKLSQGEMIPLYTFNENFEWIKYES